MTYNYRHREAIKPDTERKEKTMTFTKEELFTTAVDTYNESVAWSMSKLKDDNRDHFAHLFTPVDDMNDAKGHLEMADAFETVLKKIGLNYVRNGVKYFELTCEDYCALEEGSGRDSATIRFSDHENLTRLYERPALNIMSKGYEKTGWHGTDTFEDAVDFALLIKEINDNFEEE